MNRPPSETDSSRIPQASNSQSPPLPYEGRDRMGIFPLGSGPCHDPAIAGGKGAALSRLAAWHRVPQGFCIAAQTLAPFAGTLREWESSHPDAPPFDPPLREAIVQAYSLLISDDDPMPAVAVRSSGVDEDGGDLSFAGQHESYLNVRGAEGVINAVARCVRSAFSQRAVDYRRHNGCLREACAIAVVVQRLVPANVSAVAFTADPVTGDRTTILINASWGLGESIVGGTVTPDLYRVAASDLAIVGTRIGTKERMTIAVEDGTAEVHVPRFLRDMPALTPEEIRQIASLARELEHRCGTAVDVECALHDGVLWLLQCRPITTLGT